MRFRSMPKSASIAFASIFLLAAYSPLAVFADEPPPYEPPAAVVSNVPGKIIVPERTQVKLILDQDLKSGSAHVGDEVDYELENDLYTPDRQLVAPAGTKAYGRVLKSSGHGMFGKAGSLQISADYFLAPDRTHVPLRGNQIGNGGKNEAVGMVAMTLFVSVLGVFINGRDVNLHKGLEIPMYVNEDTAVTPYMALLNNSPNASLGIIANTAAPVQPVAMTAAAPAPVPATPGRRLYTMNDGSMVVGTQGAFDGATYAVVTDAGMKLVKASDVKRIDDLAASAPSSAPAPMPSSVPAQTLAPAPITQALAPAPTPAPIPASPPSIAAHPQPAPAPASTQWVEYTMADNTRYVGQPDGQATDGSFIFIKNSLGRRILHAKDIAGQKIVADKETGLKDGAVE